MAKSAQNKTIFPDNLADDLTRMVWMGLDGRQEDLARYVRRVLPKWQPELPQLAERLEQLLTPNSGGLVRRALALDKSKIPDDFSKLGEAVLDSPGKDFVRIENPAFLQIEPVWPQVIKSELEGLVRERRFASQLEEAGLKPTHTVVFTGLPGVGKTLAARWLARELGLPLATLNLGAVMSSFLGRTGANILQVMDFARRHPCVLLLDELDAIAKRRDDQTDIGELKRLVTVLLQELDSRPGCGLLVATTNHAQLIDPAIWRRFERRVAFPLPSGTEQLQLLRRKLGRYWDALDEKLLEAISVISSHLSQAELTLIAQRALRDHVLEVRTIRESFEDNLAATVGGMPLSERKIIGLALKKFDLGQREIHRLTGLARETLRKSEA